MDILGNISGLFGAIISILSVFVSPITKMSMCLEMINSLFLIEPRYGENQNKAKLKLKSSNDAQEVKISSSLRKMYSAKFEESQDDFIKNILK